MGTWVPYLTTIVYFFFMNALSKAKRIRERRRYEDLLALNLDGAFPPKPPLGAPFYTSFMFLETIKMSTKLKVSLLYDWI